MLKQVRITPRGSNYLLEIVYSININNQNKESKNICGIDIGINNLAILTNNIGKTPIVINSKVLKSIIKYKSENVGIKVIESDEKYTGGTSFLDNEEPSKEYYNKSRRIKRGLFKTNESLLINSDVNGSYQIIKKVFPKAFANGIEGLGLHPIRVNII